MQPNFSAMCVPICTCAFWGIVFAIVAHLWGHYLGSVGRYFDEHVNV